MKALRSTKRYGDIAIDDIEFVIGSCSLFPKKAFPKWKTTDTPLTITPHTGIPPTTGMVIKKLYSINMYRYGAGADTVAGTGVGVCIGIGIGVGVCIGIGVGVGIGIGKCIGIITTFRSVSFIKLFYSFI